MERMSVLVNTYNYGRYVVEAVASALAQSRPPDEVIVVDDGSTDDTAVRMEAAFGRETRVRHHRQRNAGQLAAFVAGLELATGDLLCFLDADDQYEAGHLAAVRSVFAAHAEVDFVFTGHRKFGASEAVHQLAPHDRHLGLSAARTLFRRAWIGSVTSTLALRRALGLQLLPGLRRLVPRWRIRADDCVVIGASLAGAQKYFRAAPTVRYRTHGANHFHGRGPAGEAADYAHWLRRDALVAVLADELGVRPAIGARAEVEFRTITAPTAAEYADYVALLRAVPLPRWKRWKMRARLYQAYHRRPAGPRARPDPAAFPAGAEARPPA